MLVVAVAMLITVGYCVWTFVTCRSQETTPVDLEGRV